MCTLVVLGLLLGLAWLVLAQIPPNMDDFSYYHLLACQAYPEARAHVFHQPCDGDGFYDLEVLGRWLPIRSYPYIGATPSWLYRPIHALFPHYESARAMGLGLALLFLAGIVRLTRLRSAAASLLLIGQAPLLLMFGFHAPVGFQLVALVWALVFALRLAEGGKSATVTAATAIGTGALLAAAFETKPLFVVVVPGMILLFLGSLARVAAPARSALRLSAAAAVGAGLTLPVLLATNRSGMAYWEELMGHATWIAWSDLGGQASHAASFLLPFLSNFSNFAHRSFGLVTGPGLALTVLFWALAAGLGALGWRRLDRSSARQLVCALLAFALTLVLLNRTQASWAAHHIVMAFPFLWIAQAIALRGALASRPRVAALLVAGILATQAIILALIPQHEPLAHTDWSRIRISRFLAESGLGERSVITTLDWGHYYLQSLYGSPGQLVIWVSPATRADLEELDRIARDRGRGHAFVFLKTHEAERVALIRSVFPAALPAQADFGGEWALWTTTANLASRIATKSP
jgi:hypothetical protein